MRATSCAPTGVPSAIPTGTTAAGFAAVFLARSGVERDFFDFLGCFFTNGCPDADYNNDNAVNSQDFFDFLGCFFAPPAGCN